MRNADPGEMTPPRSLGRCAPAVRLRRALPAYEWLDKETKQKSIRKGGKRMRRCRFSIGSAPLTSITKSDAQISGGETR
ncbi:plasmid replication initiation protein, partial [Escherichia coli]